MVDDIEHVKTVNIDTITVPAEDILAVIASANFQNDLLISFKTNRQFNKVTIFLIIMNILAIAAQYLQRTRIAFQYEDNHDSKKQFESLMKNSVVALYLK